jgi:hypothetical protein
VGLERLLDFFVAAQTGGLPFFILVAGNRVDYATYSKTKLPESCCVGCEYLSTPTFTNIIQAFFELSDQCMQGPFPSNIGEITILNSDDEITGISVTAAPPRSSSNLYDTSPSSALKNWLNVFQNSQWQGCVTKIMNATKEVVVKMDEKRHIFLASAVSNMIVSSIPPSFSSPPFLLLTLNGFSLSLLLTKSILVELVRDPESRTISGFLKLLEREWFQGSYRSSDLASTLSLSNLTDETELSAILAFSCSTDETPVLLTLLFDCVFQLMAINPSRFEFSQVGEETSHLYALLLSSPTSIPPAAQS